MEKVKRGSKWYRDVLHRSENPDTYGAEAFYDSLIQQNTLAPKSRGRGTLHTQDTVYTHSTYLHTCTLLTGESGL